MIRLIVTPCGKALWYDTGEIYKAFEGFWRLIKGPALRKVLEQALAPKRDRFLIINSKQPMNPRTPYPVTMRTGMGGCVSKNGLTILRRLKTTQEK